MKLVSFGPVATLIFAASVASAAPRNELSVGQLRERFAVRSEVFVLDVEGKRLLVPAGEERVYRASDKTGIIDFGSGIGSDQHAPIYLEGTWRVLDDGSIEGVVAQFKEQKVVAGGRPRHEGLLKRETFRVRDMASVLWKSSLDTTKAVVVRFTPSFDASDGDPLELGTLPIALSEASISDSKAQLWADRFSNVSRFVAVTTHRGRLAMSFSPFKGAKALGEAKGHRIELTLEDGRRVSVQSESPILPSGLRARVYGIYTANKKTGGLNSTSVSSTNTEDRFLQKMAE